MLDIPSYRCASKIDKQGISASFTSVCSLSGLYQRGDPQEQRLRSVLQVEMATQAIEMENTFSGLWLDLNVLFQDISLNQNKSKTRLSVELSVF